ncbi:hypothetical protein [Mycobacterium sp. SMC-11]|uniref:hypothetical protein n=1 Tax=Mycobacterium sp. SMC-11 TaxID=3385969 RepID=UPI00390C4FF9
MNLEGVQRFLDRRLSIRQIVFLGFMASTLLGAYLVIGLFWAGSHYQHLHDVRGLDKVFSVLGEIVAWPVLIIADIQLR